MDLPALSADELPIALSAFRNVALADRSTLAPEERSFLETFARLYGAEVDVERIAPRSTRDVAQAIQSPRARKRLVQLAVVMATADAEVTEGKTRAVEELAAALDTQEQALVVLRDVARGDLMRTRLHLAQRALATWVKEAYRNEGLKGAYKFLVPLLGGGANPALAWKYRQLGLLPEGTLGREFWTHFTQRRLGFPGDKNTIPERMVFHDIAHLLSGYDTDADGEFQQAAFQAGYMRNNGFSILLFAMMQFNVGLKIMSFSETNQRLFKAPKILRALQRGAACKVDLSDHWDFWDAMKLPLAEVRAMYGIPPLQA